MLLPLTLLFSIILWEQFIEQISESLQYALCFMKLVIQVAGYGLDEWDSIIIRGKDFCLPHHLQTDSGTHIDCHPADNEKDFSIP